MIKTIKPYGAVAINEILYLIKIFNTLTQKEELAFKDQYGFWVVSEETFNDLEERGIPYGRECSTTQPI